MSFSHLNYNVDNLPIFLSFFSRRCYLTSKHDNNNSNNNKVMNGAAEVATNKFRSSKTHLYIIYFYSFLLLLRLLFSVPQPNGGIVQNISDDAKNKIGFFIRNLQMTRGCCLLQLYTTYLDDVSLFHVYYFFFFVKTKWHHPLSHSMSLWALLIWLCSLWLLLLYILLFIVSSSIMKISHFCLACTFYRMEWLHLNALCNDV